MILSDQLGATAWYHCEVRDLILIDKELESYISSPGVSSVVSHIYVRVVALILNCTCVVNLNRILSSL